MVTSHLYVFTILSCAVIVHGLAPGFLRCDRKREALLKKLSEDRKLKGHVIVTHNITNSLNCAGECLRTSRCKSYNYQEAGSPLHVCELNNQSKSSAPSSDYVIQAGYSYYDADEHDVPACSSSPCQNGGTCLITGCTSDRTYGCHCPENYTGDFCETWIGSDGSSTSRPGRSCFYIKKYEKANGDGDYWIDPTRSGTPFLVTCDMTTDGGGWTVVRNATLQSSNPSGYQDITDYRSMRELNWYKIMSTDTLKSLRNDMGFNQMRIYCRKKSVGRTVHVMTAMNDLGYDVIRYFTVSTTTPATACNSYITMPDDTSLIAKDCNKIGYHLSSGVQYINRWGNVECCPGINRLYNRMINLPPNIAIVSSMDRSYYCDDFVTNNLQPGDTWVLFVR